MLEVRDIHTYYGNSYVLQGTTLRVAPGCVVAVLGRNGVGKTTLIRSIMGLSPPRAGTIVLQGADITRLPPYRIAKLGIGLVPQGRIIFPSLSVKENLDVPARSDSGNHKWTLDRILTIFPKLKERMGHRGNQLSGGEQQMLSIGRALIGNPKLLLMDEPTEGLAPILVGELGRTLQMLKAEGLSVLLVEQKITFAFKLADYVYIMSKGKIVYGSLPQQLRCNADIQHRYLGLETGGPTLSCSP